MDIQTPEKLKPCPFCGVTEKDQDEGVPFIQLDTEFSTDRFFVRCSQCGATSGYRDTEKEAIETWNARDAAGRAPLVEALEKIANWTPGIVYGSAPVDFQEMARAALEAAKGE